MAERTDEWPRCHTCLYNWCPKKSDECRRCDDVIEAMRRPDKAHYRREIKAGAEP